MDDLKFEAPAELVLQFLYEKAQSDRTLAAQIEAAQWRAAAVIERTNHSDQTATISEPDNG